MTNQFFNEVAPFISMEFLDVKDYELNYCKAIDWFSADVSPKEFSFGTPNPILQMNTDELNFTVEISWHTKFV